MEGEHEDCIITPGHCDGCGRDATACGMSELGWIAHSSVPELPGSYCVRCASSLRLIPWSECCAVCGATVDDEGVADEAGWRYYADAHGELHVFCPACAERATRLARGRGRD